MEPKDRFNKLLNFIGWGSLKNAVWFVGIEEAGGWTNNECRVRFAKETKLSEALENYDYETYVDLLINKNYNKQVEKLEYKDEKELQNDLLYKNYGIFFLKIFNDNIDYIPNDREIMDCLNNAGNNEYKLLATNLFPIGVKDSSCETWVHCFDDYQKLFDLNEKWFDKDKYMTSNQMKQRIINMRKEITQAKLVVCFGVGHYPYFINNLYLEEEVNDKEIEKIAKDHYIKFDGSRNGYYNFDKKKLLILPHISYPYNFNLVLKDRFCLKNIRNIIR